MGCLTSNGLSQGRGQKRGRAAEVRVLRLLRGVSLVIETNSGDITKSEQGYQRNKPGTDCSAALARPPSGSLFVSQPRATFITEIAFKVLAKVGCLATDATHPTVLSTQIGPYSVPIVLVALRDSHRRPPFFERKILLPCELVKYTAGNVQANKCTRCSGAKGGT